MVAIKPGQAENQAPSLSSGDGSHQLRRIVHKAAGSSRDGLFGSGRRYVTNCPDSRPSGQPGALGQACMTRRSAW
jgi:hypothetical protein